jgi:hypothetical protein
MFLILLFFVCFLILRGKQPMKTIYVNVVIKHLNVSHHTVKYVYACLYLPHLATSPPPQKKKKELAHPSPLDPDLA